MKGKRLRTFWYLIPALLMVFCTSMSYGAVTGKISGTIMDAKESNVPLIGANVMVQGTSLGAATDIHGHYTILNIPPGIYDLRVTMMGYQETVVTEVRVKTDLTTTIDVGLNITVVESGEVVTVVADRALVQPDETFSMSHVGAEDIAALPVQSMQDVLQLQAGVVRSGNDFHIRGGRANEVTFLVDGMEVTDVYDGRSMGATVEKDAIQEMQLVSGTFNAEYGKAMSGIVNIITKEGGDKYSGRLNVYAGDYLSTDDVYSVLTDVKPGPPDPVTGDTTEIEYLDNPLEDLNLTFNTDVSLSGPVPFTGDKVSFFVNGRYVTRDGYLYGSRWFTPQGLPGDSSLVAMDAREAYSALGKLSYHLTSGIKMNYQLLWDKSHEPIRGYSRAYKYVPDGLRQNNSQSYTHMFSWIHTLSEKTFYELRLARLYRKTESYLYKDPYATPHWMVNVMDSLGNSLYELDPEILGLETVNSMISDLNDEGVANAWFIDPNDQEGYVEPSYDSTPASFSFQDAGTERQHIYRDYGFMNAKLDITSQITTSNQIKAGFEAKLHELKMDEYTLIAKKDASGTQDIVPYTTDVPLATSLSRDQYTYKPLEISAYIQDKIELQEMIINIGLRFDYFDADASIPTDLRDPDIIRPLRNENIYKNWDAEYAAGLSQVELDAYKAGLTKYTSAERESFMRETVNAKMDVSPRIGIAYPITDRGIIHFSYGHFLGMPGFQYLYNDADYKMSSGGGNRLLGNPDLEPEKTVHYEIGLQQQLGEDIGLDVTLFYKDTRDWVGSSPLYKTVSAAVGYSKYVNKDYSNVYGMTLDLEKRFSRMFSARVYYAYQLAEGTYSNPNDAFDDVYNSGDPQEPRLALLPMNWDQHHTLNAYATMTTKGWTFTATAKYHSGQPYTPAVAKAELTGGASYVGWTANSQRIPASSSLDLRVLKSIPLKSFKLNLYAVAYNVLDQRGVTGVFGTTGQPDYDSNVDADYHGYNSARVGSYNEQLRRPDYYQPPREIQAGLSLEF
ncbi:TonB-dependent receptor [bacterium]|nr:TonB-dependent receptor [bacterium]